MFICDEFVICLMIVTKDSCEWTWVESLREWDLQSIHTYIHETCKHLTPVEILQLCAWQSAYHLNAAKQLDAMLLLNLVVF